MTAFASGQLVEVHSPGADQADDDVVANGIDEQEHDDASYCVNEDLLVVVHQGGGSRKGDARCNPHFPPVVVGGRFRDSRFEWRGACP